MSADQRFFVERVKWSGQPIFWMVVDYDNSREVSRHPSLEDAARSIGETLRGQAEVTEGKRMTEEIKRIDIKEFRERGYLQEVNRTFLHPLGLALEITVDDDGTETLGGVWDYRDDPEGMSYGEITAEMAANADRIAEEWDQKAVTRQASLGYVVQPLPTDG